ncbi:MAG: type II secretion system minor pseudopilin GspK [Leptothrix ochracea]|uniref:type II secretion system minor pseudopilin GspK n=1 Tax=Leptothrix ochracea TaxID=735331 RepID=UPI0034E25FDA
MMNASRQRGAALLTAMVIVTLVTTVASAMIWQQWRAIQVEAAERTQTQAQWILNGALDWARLILREDKRAAFTQGQIADHLGEPWAMPLAEARLSTFLAAERNTTEDAGPDAFLSGAISDAQARYNLRNLVQNGKVVPDEKASVLRLCEFVGVSTQTGTQLVEAVAAALLNQPQTPGGHVPLMPPRVEQLDWLKIDASAVKRLAPHLIWLPEVTPINLNTASKEVIAAVILGLDLATAERVVQSRQRKHLRITEDLFPIIGFRPPSLNMTRIETKTDFFEIVGALRLDELIVSQRSLVKRVGLEVRILSVERVGPGVLRPPAAAPSF